MINTIEDTIGLYVKNDNDGDIKKITDFRRDDDNLVVCFIKLDKEGNHTSEESVVIAEATFISRVITNLASRTEVKNLKYLACVQAKYKYNDLVKNINEF